MALGKESYPCPLIRPSLVRRNTKSTSTSVHGLLVVTCRLSHAVESPCLLRAPCWHPDFRPNACDGPLPDNLTLPRNLLNLPCLPQQDENTLLDLSEALVAEQSLTKKGVTDNQCRKRPRPLSPTPTLSPPRSNSNTRNISEDS